MSERVALIHVGPAGCKQVACWAEPQAIAYGIGGTARGVFHLDGTPVVSGEIAKCGACGKALGAPISAALHPVGAPLSQEAIALLAALDDMDLNGEEDWPKVRAAALRVRVALMSRGDLPREPSDDDLRSKLRIEDQGDSRNVR